MPKTHLLGRKEKALRLAVRAFSQIPVGPRCGILSTKGSKASILDLILGTTYVMVTWVASQHYASTSNRLLEFYFTYTL